MEVHLEAQCLLWEALSKVWEKDSDRVGQLSEVKFQELSNTA